MKMAENSNKLDVVKAVRNYILKMVRAVQGMKVLLLDEETVSYGLRGNMERREREREGGRERGRNL